MFKHNLHFSRDPRLKHLYTQPFAKMSKTRPRTLTTYNGNMESIKAVNAIKLK